MEEFAFLADGDFVVRGRGAEEGVEMCNEVCYGFCLQRIMAGQAEGL